MSTIKDVALLAGVGVGTASRAISGKGAVSAAALERVQSAVRTLEFKPSRVARALSSRSVGLVGVYVPTFEGTYFAPILQAIDSELRACSHHMVPASNFGEGSRRDKSLNGVEFLIDRQCDGILVIDGYMLDEDLVELSKRVAHLVIVNRKVRGLEEVCFSIDHEIAGRSAARSLLEQGHRELAVMHSTRHGQQVTARVEGFKSELARHGVPAPKEFVLDGLLNYPNASVQADLIAAMARRPFTALFCANDVLAMATLSRLHAVGIRVPQDLSILGYDDAEFAAYTSPALSTVRVASTVVAANACRHLMNRCYGTELGVERSFDSQTVLRHSIAPGPHPPLVATPARKPARKAARIPTPTTP